MGTSPQHADGSFRPALVAKTDIDRVAETHQREIFRHLRLLAEKLYRRNPREMLKSGQTTVDVAVARLFDVDHGWRFEVLHRTRSTQAIQLALREDFHGDRVMVFTLGLASMVQAAFNDKTEFFILDDLNPQALYNAARNVEIAVWQLSNRRNAQGELLLLSNEVIGTTINVSFEREFGKIIASLDILSQIIADKSNRTVVKVLQSMATALFLPIR